jgi:UPF0176 protein
MKVITFYKYIELENPIYWKHKLRWICKELGLKGRILLGKEGINAGVCGNREGIKEFKKKIRESEEFQNLTFREQEIKEQVYPKLVVKEREEIVVFREKVNLKKKGVYMSPERLKEMLDKKEEIVLLDVRNDYEFKVGKFKDAIDLDIKNFYDFPRKVEKLKGLKGKKIVMYCTGGIRCEKSSAYLKDKGFKDVNHLQGGIINFINKFPGEYFEGGLFVFDDRLVSSSGEVITECQHCGEKEDQYLNCHNLECDKLFVCCEACSKKMNFCCSGECKGSERHRLKKVILD